MASVEAPLQSLFASFWAAVDGRALSGLDRLAASRAFLSSLLESLVLFSRMLSNDPTANVLVPDLATKGPVAISEFVAEQIGRVWDELSTKRLKVEDTAAAGLLATTLTSLYQFNPGQFYLSLQYP